MFNTIIYSITNKGIVTCGKKIVRSVFLMLNLDIQIVEILQ